MNEKVLDERKVEELTLLIKKIVIAVVVLSVVGVLHLFIERSQERTEKDAFALLFSAEKLERELGEASNPFDPKFYESMAAWTPEVKQQYRELLEQVVSKYPSAEAGHLARLRLARVNIVDGNVSEAEELLAAVKSKASEDFIKAHSLQLLGVIYENQNKLDDALSAFDQIVSLKKAPFKPLAMLSKARVLKALNRGDEAKSVYEKVTSDFPNTIYEKQARALMAIGS
ncbi:tetratricopeptide repeat protein [bacterium]|nr:tetratricopeptide repeat protein [bacterium]